MIYLDIGGRMIILLQQRKTFVYICYTLGRFKLDDTIRTQHTSDYYFLHEKRISLYFTHINHSSSLFFCIGIATWDVFIWLPCIKNMKAVFVLFHWIGVYGNTLT